MRVNTHISSQDSTLICAAALSTQFFLHIIIIIIIKNEIFLPTTIKPYNLLVPRCNISLRTLTTPSTWRKQNMTITTAITRWNGCREWFCGCSSRYGRRWRSLTFVGCNQCLQFCVIYTSRGSTWTFWDETLKFLAIDLNIHSVQCLSELLACHVQASGITQIETQSFTKAMIFCW